VDEDSDDKCSMFKNKEPFSFSCGDEESPINNIVALFEVLVGFHVDSIDALMIRKDWEGTESSETE
jgi:hypothetical protein